MTNDKVFQMNFGKVYGLLPDSGQQSHLFCRQFFAHVQD